MIKREFTNLTPTSSESIAASFAMQYRQAKLTFLSGQELLELVSLVFNRLLLNVRSDLLQGEVSHVHLHQVQHAEYLPAIDHDIISAP